MQESRRLKSRKGPLVGIRNDGDFRVFEDQVVWPCSLQLNALDLGGRYYNTSINKFVEGPAGADSLVVLLTVRRDSTKHAIANDVDMTGWVPVRGRVSRHRSRQSWAKVATSCCRLQR